MMLRVAINRADYSCIRVNIVRGNVVEHSCIRVNIVRGNIVDGGIFTPVSIFLSPPIGHGRTLGADRVAINRVVIPCISCEHCQRKTS